MTFTQHQKFLSTYKKPPSNKIGGFLYYPIPNPRRGGFYGQPFRNFILKSLKSSSQNIHIYNTSKQGYVRVLNCFLDSLSQTPLFLANQKQRRNHIFKMRDLKGDFLIGSAGKHECGKTPKMYFPFRPCGGSLFSSSLNVLAFQHLLFLHINKKNLLYPQGRTDNKWLRRNTRDLKKKCLYQGTMGFNPNKPISYFQVTLMKKYLYRLQTSNTSANGFSPQGRNQKDACLTSRVNRYNHFFLAKCLSINSFIDKHFSFCYQKRNYKFNVTIQNFIIPINKWLHRKTHFNILTKRQRFISNSLKGILLVNFPEKEKNFLIKNLAAENKIALITQSASLLLKDSRNMDDLLGVDDPIQILFDKVKTCIPCICFINNLDRIGKQRYEQEQKSLHWLNNSISLLHDQHFTDHNISNTINAKQNLNLPTTVNKGSDFHKMAPPKNSDSNKAYIFNHNSASVEDITIPHSGGIKTIPPRRAIITGFQSGPFSPYEGFQKSNPAPAEILKYLNWFDQPSNKNELQPITPFFNLLIKLSIGSKNCMYTNANQQSFLPFSIRKNIPYIINSTSMFYKLNCYRCFVKKISYLQDNTVNEKYNIYRNYETFGHIKNTPYLKESRGAIKKPSQGRNTKALFENRLFQHDYINYSSAIQSSYSNKNLRYSRLFKKSSPSSFGIFQSDKLSKFSLRVFSKRKHGRVSGLKNQTREANNSYHRLPYWLSKNSSFLWSPSETRFTLTASAKKDPFKHKSIVSRVKLPVRTNSFFAGAPCEKTDPSMFKDMSVPKEFQKLIPYELLSRTKKEDDKNPRNFTRLYGGDEVKITETEIIKRTALLKFLQILDGFYTTTKRKKLASFLHLNILRLASQTKDGFMFGNLYSQQGQKTINSLKPPTLLDKSLFRPYEGTDSFFNTPLQNITNPLAKFLPGSYGVDSMITIYKNSARITGKSAVRTKLLRWSTSKENIFNSGPIGDDKFITCDKTPSTLPNHIAKKKKRENGSAGKHKRIRVKNPFPTRRSDAFLLGLKIPRRVRSLTFASKILKWELYLKNQPSIKSLNLLCVWSSYIEDILGSLNINDSTSYLLPEYFQLLGHGPKSAPAGKQGITLIASTNNLKTLDAALLRPGRFDTIINFSHSFSSLDRSYKILKHSPSLIQENQFSLSVDFSINRPQGRIPLVYRVPFINISKAIKNQFSGGAFSSQITVLDVPNQSIPIKTFIDVSIFIQYKLWWNFQNGKSSWFRLYQKGLIPKTSVFDSQNSAPASIFKPNTDGVLLILKFSIQKVKHVIYIFITILKMICSAPAGFFQLLQGFFKFSAGTVFKTKLVDVNDKGLFPTLFEKKVSLLKYPEENWLSSQKFSTFFPEISLVAKRSFFSDPKKLTSRKGFHNSLSAAAEITQFSPGGKFKSASPFYIYKMETRPRFKGYLRSSEANNHISNGDAEIYFRDASFVAYLEKKRSALRDDSSKNKTKLTSELSTHQSSDSINALGRKILTSRVVTLRLPKNLSSLDSVLNQNFTSNKTASTVAHDKNKGSCLKIPQGQSFTLGVDNFQMENSATSFAQARGADMFLKFNRRLLFCINDFDYTIYSDNDSEIILTKTPMNDGLIKYRSAKKQRFLSQSQRIQKSKTGSPTPGHTDALNYHFNRVWPSFLFYSKTSTRLANWLAIRARSLPWFNREESIFYPAPIGKAAFRARPLGDLAESINVATAFLDKSSKIWKNSGKAIAIKDFNINNAMLTKYNEIYKLKKKLKNGSAGKQSFLNLHPFTGLMLKRWPEVTKSNKSKLKRHLKISLANTHLSWKNEISNTVSYPIRSMVPKEFASLKLSNMKTNLHNPPQRSLKYDKNPATTFARAERADFSVFENSWSSNLKIKSLSTQNYYNLDNTILLMPIFTSLSIGLPLNKSITPSFFLPFKYGDSLRRILWSSTKNYKGEPNNRFWSFIGGPKKSKKESLKILATNNFLSTYESYSFIKLSTHFSLNIIGLQIYINLTSDLKKERPRWETPTILFNGADKFF